MGDKLWWSREHRLQIGETAELLPGSVTTVTLRKPVLKPNECLSIPQLRGKALLSARWRECHALSRGQEGSRSGRWDRTGEAPGPRHDL